MTSNFSSPIVWDVSTGSDSIPLPLDFPISSQKLVSVRLKPSHPLSSMSQVVPNPLIPSPLLSFGGDSYSTAFRKREARLRLEFCIFVLPASAIHSPAQDYLIGHWHATQKEVKLSASLVAPTAGVFYRFLYVRYFGKSWYKKTQ